MNSYAILEKKHWWFRARARILYQVLKVDLGKISNISSILNAGAATGATSLILCEFGKVTSLEKEGKYAEHLAELFPHNVINKPLEASEIKDEQFDVVCAFDVIEHIENDALALAEVYRILKTKGKLFVTVPAFMSLWGEHDVANKHYRRYKLKELKQLVEKAGFSISYLTYFNFLLFLPIYVVRKLQRLISPYKKEANAKADFSGNNSNIFLNKILFSIFSLEVIPIKYKIVLPIGVSLLIVAVKQ